MPLAPVNAGKRCPKSPDSSVEVVEATVMNSCWAEALKPAASAIKHPAKNARNETVKLPPSARRPRGNAPHH